MSNLVVGKGEIGTALMKLLNCDGHDPIKNLHAKGKYDVIHIAFPYYEGFISNVRFYQEYFEAKLVIIHSTVPVGTSKKLGAVHSPCRGQHPNLFQGLLRFVKFFGGKNSIKAAKIFSKLGIKTYFTKDSNNTEAMKLWDTTQYGVNILLEKEIHEYCVKNKLDFNVVYTEANKTYNRGYGRLRHTEYKKYVLKHVDGPIGGHCVVNNARLLDSKSAKAILAIDKKSK